MRNHTLYVTRRNTDRQCSHGVDQWMDKVRTVYRFSSARRKCPGRDGSIYKVLQRGTACILTGVFNAQTVQRNICNCIILIDCMSKIQFKCPIFVDQCTSDMTAFRLKGIYYELTLYMDLWNNEILSHSLSAKRGDRMTYISGLHSLIELKKQHPEYRTVLHSDQGIRICIKKLQ